MELKQTGEAGTVILSAFLIDPNPLFAWRLIRIRALGDSLKEEQL
jgi:hypothetical protein